jgi:hypothetical protein
VDFNLHKFMEVQIEGSREVNRPVIDYHLTVDMGKVPQVLGACAGNFSSTYKRDQSRRARGLCPPVRVMW